MAVAARYSCRVWWWEVDEAGEKLVKHTKTFTSAEKRDSFLLNKVNKGEIFDILAVSERFWTEGSYPDAALVEETAENGFA